MSDRVSMASSAGGAPAKSLGKSLGKTLRGVMQSAGDEGAVEYAAQRLRHRQNAEIEQRLDDNHERVGRAEGRDRRQIVGAQAAAIDGPERDPRHDAGLIRRRKRQRLTIEQVDISGIAGDDAVGKRADRKQGHQERRHVHAVLRQVAWHEEQALQQKPERQSEGSGRGAENQKQRRAEDEMNLGYADREMRQHLE